MCAASVILDFYSQRWNDRYKNPEKYSNPPKIGLPLEEIWTFHQLYDLMKDYDEENDQPDCEVEIKKEKLMRAADKLGRVINFAN